MSRMPYTVWPHYHYLGKQSRQPKGLLPGCVLARPTLEHLPSPKHLFEDPLFELWGYGLACCMSPRTARGMRGDIAVK